MMKLRNLCSMFDVSSIVDKQSQVSNTFIASSEVIFSDGIVHHHINKEGYIEITGIEGEPNYVMFMDQGGEVFINIYRYTPETLYKEIIDNLNKLYDEMGINHEYRDVSQITSSQVIIKDTSKNNANKQEKKSVSNIDTSSDRYSLHPQLSDRVVDMNTFKCPDCGILMKYRKIPNTDTIIGYCSKCFVEYTLVPSRWYTIKARKVNYSAMQHSRNFTTE